MTSTFTTESYEVYKKEALKFAFMYHVEVSPHILDLMISVMLTRDNIREGGSFVKAVVRNDLYDAISRADSESLANLRIITLCNQFCHINHY